MMTVLVREWMTPNPLFVTQHATLGEAHLLLQSRDIRHLPIVTDDGSLLGMVTRSEMRHARLQGVADSAEIATLAQKVPTVTPETTMQKATITLLRKKQSALLVVDEAQQLVGILTESDMLYQSLLQTTQLPNPKTVTLRDGAKVIIRPIHPHDAHPLREMYASLSTRSTYLRFLEMTNPLKASTIRRFSLTDYSDQMAFVAIDPVKQQLIGIVQYLPLMPHLPGRAEYSAAIVDKWQGRGLGRHLMETLIAYGREHGIEALLGTIHHENRPMLKLIRSLDLRIERKLEYGVYDAWIWLNEPKETT